MKSFGKYISKYLASFTIFIILLVLINILYFCWTFHNVISKDYGAASPQNMLDEVAATSSTKTIADEMVQKLRHDKIWAMYINQTGSLFWYVDLPDNIPSYYTLQDVAIFAKGYLYDYPVFIRSTEHGLLVLGYPKDSYTKLISNYYPINAIRKLPVFLIIMLVTDCLFLFLAYYLSKQKITKSTDPIINALGYLSDGKTTSLSLHGELSEIADSINKASKILSRQNEARANWISGVSHDIRTPLSMIMGYADYISSDTSIDHRARESADIIRRQSIKIKELVQDLNLVSQLEYEMQPLNKEKIRLSKLIRTYVVDLLNAGISDIYSVEVEIFPQMESIIFECDRRLISRAISNLVQNSINHNPQGCKICLLLNCTKDSILLTVTDDGIGFLPEKLYELHERPHYIESTDERLDLRHGLGLLLVRQIIEAHYGTIQIESEMNKGCKTTLTFPRIQS